MRPTTLAWMMVLAFLAAGCTDAGDGLDAIDDAADAAGLGFVNPIVLEHDHGDLSEHTITNNIDLVGRDPVGADGLPPGPLGEIDVAGHWAFVAVFNVGFAIIDLSDPKNPTTVSVVEIPTPPSPAFGKYTADLKTDATGDWVFLAMEVSATPGVLIYDVRDKANPELAGFWPEPGLLLGCHMVEYGVIDGEEYLFCAPLDNAIYIGQLMPPTPTGHREVVQVARFAPHTPKFVEENLAAGADAPGQHVSGHHDMTFMEDPLTGTPMLYVSFWSLGLRFVDVSIPALPLEVGSWDGEGAAKYDGNIHTTMAFESEDRRIVVTVPEVANPPAMFVLDATDFSDVKVLSEWMAVDDYGPQYGTFSTHNFQIVEGKVYMAHYHGGLWVLDISTAEKQAAPEPVASYLPHEPRPDGQDYSVGAWDVVVWNGYMLTADGNGGFYVLHRAGDPAGDPEYTSFA